MRSGGTVRVFVNGSQTFTTNIGTAALCVPSSNNISVGTSSSTTVSTAAGYYDDIRITKGVARYSGGFIPMRNP